jgi:uncharacterized protein
MNPTVTVDRVDQDTTQGTKIAVIDADFHPSPRPDPNAGPPANAFALPSDPSLLAHIPKRWRDYVDMMGLRPAVVELQLPRHRPYGNRTDSISPAGGPPGSDPEFTRGQLLDAYDMSGVMVNNILPVSHIRGANNYPREMSVALATAFNEWHRERWLDFDDRFYATINVPYEHPEAAVKEIERCRAISDRYVQVFMGARADHPIGNPKYWPIFEACEAYGIPIGFHVAGHRRITASGVPTSYYEENCDFALRPMIMVPSLIFEGVFERFPNLQCAFIELGWSWAMPLSWRMDATYRVLRKEVSHLQRKPSEYVRDHFWFSTQPSEEPANLEWGAQVYEMFEESQLLDHLMYSSDYPHWDFDAPSEGVPAGLPLEWRRKVLGENASRLYGIPLKPDSGIPVEG